MITTFDHAFISWNLLLFAFLEVILIGWIYGIKRFRSNLKTMNLDLGVVIGKILGFYFLYIFPLILLLVCISEFFCIFSGERKNLDLLTDIILPLSTVCIIPIMAIYEIWRRYKAGKSLKMALIKPTEKWRPTITTMKSYVSPEPTHSSFA